MGVEIERKFLVQKSIIAEPESWEDGILIKQGYLSVDPCVRVRLFKDMRNIPRKTSDIHHTWQGCITIKGNGLLRRPEFEYGIPLDDAEDLFDMAPYKLDKVRRFYIVDGMRWSVDFFIGELDGFMLAEVELESEDQSITIPNWSGKEVTFDKQYANVNLAMYGVPK